MEAQCDLSFSRLSLGNLGINCIGEIYWLSRQTIHTRYRTSEAVSDSIVLAGAYAAIREPGLNNYRSVCGSIRFGLRDDNSSAFKSCTPRKLS